MTRRVTTLHKARNDLAHVLAHFAVLHRGGAVLVDTKPESARGGWMLHVDTVAGPLAWPIRDEDLPLFDRVTRVTPNDPRATGASDAANHRNHRLETLTDAAWGGAGGLGTFMNGDVQHDPDRDHRRRR